MGNDKPDSGKVPAKVETINLKVYIHCEGCRKKVKKILNNIEGVHTVSIDASIGKVTVTGTVDSKTLIKKLEKSGKVVEVWSNPQTGGGGKGGQQKEKEKDEQKQQKGEEKEGKGSAKEGDGEGEKKGKGGGNNNNNSNKSNNNGAGGGNSEGGKKKKGGTSDGGVDDSSEASTSKNTANKNMAGIMVETGYTMESADYATHIFSDENANNCSIM